MALSRTVSNAANVGAVLDLLPRPFDGAYLIANKGYDSDGLHCELRHLGVVAGILTRSSRKRAISTANAATPICTAVRTPSAATKTFAASPHVTTGSTGISSLRQPSPPSTLEQVSTLAGSN